MPQHYGNLNAEKALIWRIVHRDNVAWLLDNDIPCASAGLLAPRYTAIGNADLIASRSRRAVPVPPGGSLADYVPFYFTPFSPMMFNIHTGRGAVPQRPNSEICILVFSLRRLASEGVAFVFTDRHAKLNTARFFSSLDELSEIDWPLLQARNFSRNPDDPEQIERYQAEALVYRSVPVRLMAGLVCHDEQARAQMQSEVDRRGLGIPVRAMPQWYFT